MAAQLRPPNIVTIVLDCSRAKNFSTSGVDHLASTPVIDSLAARGTTFPRAVAPANWTVPSHFSMFTGTYPNVHGHRSVQQKSEPPDNTAAYLHRGGYETAMFSENVHLVSGHGLEQGFDLRVGPPVGMSDEGATAADGSGLRSKYLYTARIRKLIGQVPALIAPISFLFRAQEVAFKREICGNFTLEKFSEWIAGIPRGRPFYSFLNFVDTHDPYEFIVDGAPLSLVDRVYLSAPRYFLLAVPSLRSRVRWDALLGGYIKTIEDVDRKIGVLLKILAEHGELGRTLIVITSDHGQSFGEGGNAYHGCGATDSVTRVPLVVVPPEGVSVPRRIERWVSLCEIDSWIRSAAAGMPPYDEAGHAYAGHAGSAPNSDVVFCEGNPASDVIRPLRGICPDQSWNHRLLAAYRENEKFVLDLETSEVFHWAVDGDPDLLPPTRLAPEVAQLARTEIFGPYETQEASRLAKIAGGPPPIDVGVDQRLRSWGYE